jgi:hypothetical protein
MNRGHQPPAPFVPFVFPQSQRYAFSQFRPRRPSGSDFFVAWRSGNSECYVRYLSADEWRGAKKESAASFA